MVKVLRITSYLLAAAAVCGVVVLASLGLKGNPDSRAFLEQKGVIEQLKNQSQVAAPKEDAASPLVTQAKAFALRIDPPPLPPPPHPTPAPGTQSAQTAIVRPPVVAPPRPVTVHFELVATANYKDHPERSLALLKPVSSPAKWLRQGEKMGHLEIHEIRDGSVVLYQDGKLNTELFVPTPKPTTKPLLKSDADAWAKASGTGAATVAMQPGSVTETEISLPETPEETALEDAGSSGGRIVRSITRRPPAQTVDAGAPTPEPVVVREPTPAEQKESVEQSISSIQSIMTSSTPDASPEDQQAEKAAWAELLKALQQEKTALESATPAKDEPTAEPNAATGE